MGDGQARGYRLHDRPEPQSQGQDRGDDPDRDDGHGTVRESGAGGSREAGRLPGALRAGGRGELPERRVLERRAAGDSRMGAIERPACRSHGRLPAERIPGADHGRARCEEHGGGLELCIASNAQNEDAMPRYAFKLQIKANAIEEYEREHQRVWPELLAKLKEVGISDYSIFRRGQELVLCLRVDDFDKAWDELDRDPV